ncbi:MAG: hypothetical protein H7274_17545 [Rhodoferax sp.]|nr:hypothetical protein [Rhodoferax sp.]
MKIRINEDTSDLIRWHATTTGLAPDAIVDRLLSAHLAELHEAKAFYEAHDHDRGMQEEAANLLISYGGQETLLAGIKRLAPDFETLEARFVRAIDSPGPGLSATVL